MITDQRTLPDGRRVGLAHYGQVDGYPLIYSHGFPGSRLEAAMADNECRRRQLRLIGLDRPGYGQSDPVTKPDLLAWARDVGHIADQLDLKEFSLLGVSGGTPAALALASQLGERVKGLILICGLGPLADQRLQRLLPFSWRLSLWPLLQFPWLGKTLSQRLIRWLAAEPERAMRLFSRKASKPDQAMLQLAAIAPTLNQSLHESLRQQGDGCLLDLQLYSSPWPFRLEEITTPVSLWHGLQDTIVHPACARFYEQVLPNCQAHYLPDEGHFSLPIRRMAEILASLPG